MIQYKPGVVLRPFHAYHGMQAILDAADRTSPPTVGGIVVVTSAHRASSLADSLHPEDRAFDFRVRSSDPELDGNVLAPGPRIAWRMAGDWVMAMRIALGEGYDVIREADMIDTGDGVAAAQVIHIHAEWDPPEGIEMPKTEPAKPASVGSIVGWILRSPLLGFVPRGYLTKAAAYAQVVAGVGLLGSWVATSISTGEVNPTSLDAILGSILAANGAQGAGIRRALDE